MIIINCAGSMVALSYDSGYGVQRKECGRVIVVCDDISVDGGSCGRCSVGVGVGY